MRTRHRGFNSTSINQSQSRQEKLVRSGPEYRLTSDHSVTVRGNEWFDHASERGGGPVSFLQQFYNLSYP